MANKEHLKVLRQGVDVWNKWREETQIWPDLTRADLTRIPLSTANLWNTDLRGANLRGVDLWKANLTAADLENADLWGAHLSDTNLKMANLRNAKLNGVDINGTNLSSAILSGADFDRATAGDTHFDNLDLRHVKNLMTIQHGASSSLDYRTLVNSEGHIPVEFLRGCGFSDTYIEYIPSLISSLSPIQYHSVFISYSHHDQPLAQRIHNDLQDKGVRCWFAPHDLKTGERYHYRIDEAIRRYDKLLLILSEHSVESAWVEREVLTALDKEQHTNRSGSVLFPIMLDNSILQLYPIPPWATYIRNQIYIGDFTAWKHDRNAYTYAFERLLRDLKASSEQP
jgi:hypothetical protein